MSIRMRSHCWGWYRFQELRISVSNRRGCKPRVFTRSWGVHGFGDGARRGIRGEGRRGAGSFGLVGSGLMGPSLPFPEEGKGKWHIMGETG